MKALQGFAGPRDEVHLIYTDGAKELAAAAAELGWRHDTATPYRPQTNGVAERNVRRVLEGTRASLTASGLAHHWWPDASRCFCDLYNFTQIIRGNMTAYELRHGESFPVTKSPLVA